MPADEVEIHGIEQGPPAKDQDQKPYHVTTDNLDNIDEGVPVVKDYSGGNVAILLSIQISGRKHIINYFVYNCSNIVHELFYYVIKQNIALCAFLHFCIVCWDLLVAFS